jgi:hypothetical protein
VKKLIYLFLGFMLDVLTGCNVLTPPTDADLFARKIIGELANNKYMTVIEALDSTLVSESDTKLLQVVSKLQNIKMDSLELINWRNLYVSDGLNRTFLEYQAPTKSNWVYINIVLDKKDSTFTISGIHENDLPNSLHNINKFTFQGKSMFHFLFLLYSICVLLVTIYALYICYRTTIKRKWIWVILIIFSFPSIYFNWSSGEVAFNLLSFVLLGFGATSIGNAGPWIIQTSIPVVAIYIVVEFYNRTGLNNLVPEGSESQNKTA